MLKVLIYSDEGVDGGSLRHLHRSLQQEIDLERCAIFRMGAQDLIDKPWEEETALLVFPGGRDCFYHKSLDGAGTEKIRRYVQHGGRFLGICAGAYFACSEIEFEKGEVLEVCGARSLKLFPGLAKGSAFGPNKYSYENARGVEAARISSEIGECPVYFNGGCLFVGEEQYPWVKTIGRYLDLPGAPPAVLEITMEKGLAILSGVHIEYIPHLLNRDDFYLSQHIPTLSNADSIRRAIFRSYLLKLGLPLKKSNDK